MSVQTYEPMAVHRVDTERGSHIEPPLEQAWPEIEKLRWHAGVVTDATGITIRIQTGTYQEKRLGRWRIIPGMYSISWENGELGSAGIGPFDYHRAWTFLTGFESGAQAAKRANRD